MLQFVSRRRDIDQSLPIEKIHTDIIVVRTLTAHICVKRYETRIIYIYALPSIASSSRSVVYHSLLVSLQVAQTRPMVSYMNFQRQCQNLVWVVYCYYYSRSVLSLFHAILCMTIYVVRQMIVSAAAMVIVMMKYSMLLM